MIGVNEYLPGALVAGAAFAVLWATSRRPCRCQGCRPRRDSIELIREDDELRRQWTEWAETVRRNNEQMQQHITPTQVRVRGTLLRPGRELDRGDRW